MNVCTYRRSLSTIDQVCLDSKLQSLTHYATVMLILRSRASRGGRAATVHVRIILLQADKRRDLIIIDVPTRIRRVQFAGKNIVKKSMVL